MSEPQVSVVLISYNDAARLPRAIRSLQRQTLSAIEIIVVDDASTDGSADVVSVFAAADSRIRYERLAANSGGCSAPRNRGVELARAPWVMFCDSDDEYERHACANLLRAVESTGADLACGTAERIDVRSGRTKRWRPEVHADVQNVGSLADFPDLLYDTISVNKIYRRELLLDNGIRFPEGLLYEDQLFTLEAMSAASRIAVIPETVYRWYVDHVSDEPSITQRRDEARNVASRVEINRRMDAFLEQRGMTDIRAVKELKFLRHDLYLYLASMLELDDDAATTLVDHLVPYVESLDLRRAWELRTALRVAVYHLLVRDIGGIRSAMRFVKWASVVDVPIVARDGREYWGTVHLDAGPDAGGIAAREWLDVTDLHLRSIPLTQRRYLHRIDSLSVSDNRLVIEGSTVDYDGALAGADSVDVRFLINGDRTAARVAAGWTGQDGIRRQWRADGILADALRRPLAEKDRGTLGVAVGFGDLVNVTSARAPESAVVRTRVPFPGHRTWTGPDTFETGAHDNGAVGWRAIRTSRSRTRMARLRAGWFRLPGATRLATVWGLVRRDLVSGVVVRIGHVLPRRRLTMLEGEQGRSFGGNVRALGDALARQRPNEDQAWAYRVAHERVPAGAEAVERSSLRHAWLLSRANVVIVDSEPPAGASPRAVVVNAGDGVPVHRLGLDDPSVLVSKSATAAVRRAARQWRLLVAASPEAAAIDAGAFGYRGATVDAGIPRMDGGVRARASAGGRADLRGRLDLPSDRPVVLYAPAARPGSPVDAEPLLDVERWAASLGERCYLVVWARPADAIAVPTRLRAAVRALTDADDVSSFVAASDLVVSDYSSVIGDAALLDLPIVLFQPDRERYVARTRGVYPGLEAVGPVVTDGDALIDEVRRWLDDPVAWRPDVAVTRRAWATRCGPADGAASERAIEGIRAMSTQGGSR